DHVGENIVAADVGQGADAVGAGAVDGDQLQGGKGDPARETEGATRLNGHRADGCGLPGRTEGVVMRHDELAGAHRRGAAVGVRIGQSERTGARLHDVVERGAEGGGWDEVEAGGRRIRGAGRVAGQVPVEIHAGPAASLAVLDVDRVQAWREADRP